MGSNPGYLLKSFLLYVKIFLDEDLDCICCFEELGLNGAHIYQCSKGHVICPKCKQKLQSCPQCREVYGTVGIRNLILESIILKLKPKSQIQKKPEGKKHSNQRLMPRTNQFRQQEQYQHQQNQIREQEQLQQQQQQHQMWQQFSQGMQRLQQLVQLEEETARQQQQPHNGHQMSR